MITVYLNNRGCVVDEYGEAVRFGPKKMLWVYHDPGVHDQARHDLEVRGYYLSERQYEPAELA